MYGDADEALRKKESVLYLANHQSTGELISLFRFIFTRLSSISNKKQLSFVAGRIFLCISCICILSFLYLYESVSCDSFLKEFLEERNMKCDFC